MCNNGKRKPDEEATQRRLKSRSRTLSVTADIVERVAQHQNSLRSFAATPPPETPDELDRKAGILVVETSSIVCATMGVELYLPEQGLSWQQLLPPLRAQSGCAILKLNDFVLSTPAIQLATLSDGRPCSIRNAQQVQRCGAHSKKSNNTQQKTPAERRVDRRRLSFLVWKS